MIKKIIGIAILAITALFILIQLVPYGHNHTNPPVTNAAQWSSPEAQAVAERACYDCHSNQTTWPWYSNIAPMSWLVQHDVEDGRRHLNFSQWGQGRQRTRDIPEVLRRGNMPPAVYLILHPDANLSDSEKQLLLQGLPGVANK
jgi:hypothetical protein